MSADRMLLVVSLSLSLAAWHGQNVWAEDGPSTSGEREAGGNPKQEEGQKQAIPLPPKRKQPEPGPEAFILSSDVVKGQIPVKSWKTLRDRQIVKQDQDYTCGAASLATLLNGVYGKTLRTGLHVRCPPVGTNILSFQDARWPAADGHLTNS